MIFDSKIDTVFKMILLLCFSSVGLLMGLGFFLFKESPSVAYILFGVGIADAAIFKVLVWPVRYVLESESLIVSFGMMKTKIAYSDIESVLPSRSGQAAPALSMERYQIKHGALGTIVSPENSVKFLQALGSHTPHLRFDGDRLVSNKE